MNILALDLGSNTGWALASSGRIVSGVWVNKPSNARYEGGGMRYLRFRRQLVDLHATSPIGAVYFEEVRRHRGTDAAHVYGGMLGTLTAWCESLEPPIPYEGIPVGEIKKHLTGKGNADKPAMIAAVRALGYDVTDDNEADAIALALLVLGSGGHRKAGLHRGPADRSSAAMTTPAVPPSPPSEPSPRTRRPDMDSRSRSTEQDRAAFRDMLRLMPGYPWLPCPICKGTESCDHIAAERARASGITFVPDKDT